MPLHAMLNKELIKAFWQVFKLVTQEEDTNFPIVNPQDAIRTLVKCRNWVGTFTEMLIANNNLRAVVLKSFKHERFLLSQIEQYWYAELLAEGQAVSALKTKELAQALITKKTQDDTTYHSIQLNIMSLENELEELNHDRETLDLLLKKLEKTTDWLRDYLNWVKYELRTLQN